MEELIMKEFKIFSNPEFGRVRVVIADKKPWFIAKDIAKVLGYKDTDDAIRRHVDDEDKLTR